MTTLPIPDSLDTRDSNVEVLRLWAGGGQQLLTLQVGYWPDPAAWGIVLADLARHCASAYAADSSHSYDDALARITEGLLAEQGAPTEVPGQ